MMAIKNPPQERVTGATVHHIQIYALAGSTCQLISEPEQYRSAHPDCPARSWAAWWSPIVEHSRDFMGFGHSSRNLCLRRRFL